MRRLKRSAASFAIVLVAYSLYALLAVPWIEPVADARPMPRDGQRAAQQDDPEFAAFAALFPAGSWELDNPKILENEQFKLLIRDYRNMGDGRVELRPCTMILMPNSLEADPAKRAREAIVLQAPHGALLTFDRPFNISRGDIGRLTAGQLNGPITIRSEGKNAGPEDNLLLTTRDVQMNEQQVWTPHVVDFAWGPHHGRGQQMRIKLLRGENRGRGPSIAGIELFELAHIERLHVELGESKPQAATPGAPPTKMAGGFFRPRSADGNVPLEIAFRGPFRCDMVQQMATFEDQVNVWRINPTGPADQLNCDLLMIEFTERASLKEGVATHAAADWGGAKSKSQSFDMAAERIEARGNPVVLNAPSEQLNARGQRLEYHLLRNRITLDGSEEAFLKQGPNEIHGRGLQYTAATNGGLGLVRAGGPGWLRAQTADRPDQILEARWGEQLLIRPHEQSQLISLLGGGQLAFRGFAQLGGKEIHFWLREVPGEKAGQTRLQPERMLARDDVRIAVTNAAVTNPFVASPQPHYAMQVVASSSPWRAADSSPLEGVPAPLASPWYDPTANAMGISPAAEMAPPPAPRRPQHFEVSGRLLRARVVLHEGEQGEVSELMIEESVKLVETLTAEPDELPMRVSGERLHVVDAMRPHAAVTITGQPAHFEARGLGLTGANINLNRGTNRLWIEGTGWMDLPINRDLDGQPLAKPGALRVDWQRQMSFDGQTARFDETVIASTPTMSLRTEALEVRFQQPMNFADEKTRQNPEVEEMVCRGGVLMENRTFAEDQQTSFDRMQVADLMMNMRTGAILAAGPGWLSSVRRGGAEDEQALTMGLPGSASQGAPSGDELRGLEVRFQGSITGNLHQRAMQFNNQVAAAFAPVADWTATLPTDQPTPKGAVMHCDQLAVNQVVVPMSDRRAMELMASGNTVVEGDVYTARAARMTYAEAKDLLVFEGDGRNDANLWRQQQVGGERSHVAARKILYWPKTRKLWVNGAQSVELSGPK
jgi:lipopolysaccharide export system protein LptA